MSAHPRDSPGVHIPPPLIWIGGLGAAAQLRRYVPLTIGWDAPRIIVAWV